MCFKLLAPENHSIEMLLFLLFYGKKNLKMQFLKPLKNSENIKKLKQIQLQTDQQKLNRLRVGYQQLRSRVGG